MVLSSARSLSPHHLYWKLVFWMRVITCVCGSLLGVVLVALHMMQPLHFVLEDYALGCIATALAWTITGFILSPSWMHHWMGAASNGLCTTSYSLCGI